VCSIPNIGIVATKLQQKQTQKKQKENFFSYFNKKKERKVNIHRENQPKHLSFRFLFQQKDTIEHKKTE
jgi:hypothetical protein